MKMYVRLFLYTSISFGLLKGIRVGLATGVESGIKAGAISGLFFGIGMSLILGTIYRLRIKKMGIVGDLGPVQSTTVELISNLDFAYDKCIQALNQFGAKIKLQNQAKSEIKATTGITWKSWGEVLSLHLIHIGNQKVKIEISSFPKLRTTIVDYGKGRENVQKIANLLGKEGLPSGGSDQI